MSGKPPKDSNQENEEYNKPVKLDKTKQTDIKEKVYTTRQVETSITLLESPEYDVVLEALLFISKYADLNKNNLTFLVKNSAIEKLLNNFSKNICILRLSLRLLSVLLDCEDGLFEIDQDKFDNKIVEIARMFMEHKDGHVREFSVEVLAKLSASCRVTTLIFQVELFNPIFDSMKNTKNQNILYNSTLLFYHLVDAPAAVSALPDCPRFDLNTVLTNINHKEEFISNLSLRVVEKLTGYGLAFLQQLFRKLALMEKMFKIVMNEQKEDQHLTALNIIHNCLNSEDTSTYYIESFEFLELCQWLKTCPTKYLLSMSELFTKLTSVPELKQTLFDLSVEETILQFFRFNHKTVLNKTCEAVTNMTSHKYCCEAMLTPVVADTLLSILQRTKDDEDPFNEVVLKTIFCFIRRYIKGLDIFLAKNMKPILLDYFLNKSDQISEQSFLMIMEILYRCLVHPGYQEEFATEMVLSKMLTLFLSSSVPVSTNCCEIFSNLVTLQKFRQFFLENKGPTLCIDLMKRTEDLNLLTQIYFLIFACLSYEDIAMCFLHSGLLPVIKNFNLDKIPISRKVKELALNYYLPLKFYETGQLQITDKLPSMFYLINGDWKGSFPFLEILEMMLVSPYPTIYVVDYSYEVMKNPSQTTIESSTSLTSRSISVIKEPSSVMEINYGKITNDFFLPRYVYHLHKYDKYTKGNMEDRICLLAEYVDTLLCGPKDNLTVTQKIHEYKLHLQCLKQKLGNNIIPIGFLRLGFHCERALLFKCLADKICIPCSLTRGNFRIYWNEVALFENIDGLEKIRFYVVDLMNDIGNLMLVGSREANKYCNLN